MSRQRRTGFRNGPVTTLVTPGGTAASTNSSTLRYVVSEASSAILITAVQPVVSKPPLIPHSLIGGVFQGMIPPNNRLASTNTTLACMERGR